MNWIKKRYDQFILVLAASALLGLSGLLALRAKNFPENFADALAIEIDFPIAFRSDEQDGLEQLRRHEEVAAEEHRLIRAHAADRNPLRHRRAVDDLRGATRDEGTAEPSGQHEAENGFHSGSKAAGVV